MVSPSRFDGFGRGSSGLTANEVEAVVVLVEPVEHRLLDGEPLGIVAGHGETAQYDELSVDVDVAADQQSADGAVDVYSGAGGPFHAMSSVISTLQSGVILLRREGEVRSRAGRAPRARCSSGRRLGPRQADDGSAGR